MSKDMQKKYANLEQIATNDFLMNFVIISHINPCSKPF